MRVVTEDRTTNGEGPAGKSGSRPVDWTMGMGAMLPHVDAKDMRLARQQQIEDLVRDTCQPSRRQIGSAPRRLAVELDPDQVLIRATIACVGSQPGIALITSGGVYFAAADRSMTRLPRIRSAPICSRRRLQGPRADTARRTPWLFPSESQWWRR